MSSTLGARKAAAGWVESKSYVQFTSKKQGPCLEAHSSSGNSRKNHEGKVMKREEASLTAVKHCQEAADR